MNPLTLNAMLLQVAVDRCWVEGQNEKGQWSVDNRTPRITYTHIRPMLEQASEQIIRDGEERPYER